MADRRLALRPVHDDDVPALAGILREPEVARWWGEYDDARLREELAEVSFAFAIMVDDSIAGLLYAFEETDPDYPSVAFDVALTTRLHGRGHGREAMRLVVEQFIARGHHRFTIDPAAENERAIRSYTGLGFRPVGILRRYERAPDGSWRDGLLMDLLAEELG